MTKNLKLLLSFVMIASVSLLAGCGNLGGSIHNTQESFDEGIAVDGNTVIDGDRKLSALEKTEAVAAINTLTAEESGLITFIGTTGATTTLPAVEAGLIYRFVVSSAFTTNAIIASAEGDNIEGALIVAGAVVDCAGEDKINFVADGENVGDFVELRSDGTSWLIGASGGLTSAKITCTDPS